MMNNSLGISDILQLVLICMIVFFPIGFICGLNFYRIKAIYRLARRFRSGIKDEGAFSKFIKQ